MLIGGIIRLVFILDLYVVQTVLVVFDLKYQKRHSFHFKSAPQLVLLSFVSTNNDREAAGKYKFIKN